MIPRGPISGFPILRDQLAKPERSIRGALCEALVLSVGTSNAASEKILRLLDHVAGGKDFPDRVRDALREWREQLRAERAALRTLEQAQEELRAGTVSQLSGGSPGAILDQAAVPSRDTGADQANGGERQGEGGEGGGRQPACTPSSLPPRLSWCCSKSCSGVIPASSADRYRTCAAHGLQTKQWPAGEPEPTGLAAEIGDDLPDYPPIGQPTRGQVELVGQVINRLPRLGGPCAGCGEPVSLDATSWIKDGREYHVDCMPDQRKALALRAADCKAFKARHDAAKLVDGQPQGDPVCVLCDQAITRGQLARRLEGSSRKRVHDSCVVLWLEDTARAQ